MPKVYADSILTRNAYEAICKINNLINSMTNKRKRQLELLESFFLIKIPKKQMMQNQELTI